MDSEVRALLQKFQDGYSSRDLAQVEAFMDLFVAGEELEVIGTGAVKPPEGEWCQGRVAVRRLVASDWEYWGDVAFDVGGAHISVKGDVAWLATTGTVTDTIPAEQRYNGYLKYVAGVLADEKRDEKGKTLEIVSLGSDIVEALPMGEIFVWPFRFTAVAVKEGGTWRFHQMQFSFATTRAPDVRL